MGSEIILFGAAVIAAAWLVSRSSSQRRSLAWSGLLVFAAAAAYLFWDPPAAILPPANRPATLAESNFTSDQGFVGSTTCRPCHPDQHASWSRSYHRTMTQVVTPDTVLGDFDDLTLYFDGREYWLHRVGDEFRVDLSDPDQVDQVIALAQAGAIDQAQSLASTIPVVSRQIVMSTGSHHYQLYWYSNGRGRELNMLPFVYLRDEQRWVPRVSVFLNPPNQVEPRKVWNRECLPCHTTGGRPGYEPGGSGEPSTFLAEPGISCEACHGPADEHIAANRDPIRRYSYHLSGDSDESIVQPLKIAGRRGAQVCGRCHSLHTQYDGEAWAASFVDGIPFRPGDNLSDGIYVVQPKTLSESPLMEQFVRDRPGSLDEWFWSDGTIRVVGREYNGLVASPCYGDENFTCMSCHSIHDSDPNDQLRAGMDADEACLQCHDGFRQNTTVHTHHAPESDGSRCMNCHMPHTSYGLLKASRSHTVSSPSIASEISTGRPNACNLCHMDQTLQWTAGFLANWYGMGSPELDDLQRTVASGPLWLLAGDAGLRAITAWNTGQPETQAAAGTDWMGPVLAPLLEDPYDAVRYGVGRAVRKLPGMEDFDYDYLAGPTALADAAARASRRPVTGDARYATGLYSADGQLDYGLIQRLLQRRDDRPVYIVE